MSFPSHGKVLFSATLVRGHIAKFHIPYLRWFKEQGWETWVAAKNDYPNEVCSIPYCDHFINIDFARSPFSTQTLVAYNQLKKLFANEHFDLVHTHTPVGSVLTRLAARKYRKLGTKVIYTAHGFHFYEGSSKSSWLLWYPIERYMTRYCDMLLTINDEDYRRAKSFACCEVRHVPGVGVDIKRHAKARDAHLIEHTKERDSYVRLLSVGDLNENKNHSVLLEMMTFLPSEYRLDIAGEGPLRDMLLSKADELGLSERVSLLGFRNDIPDLLETTDIFLMPSKREGLPVSMLEAMASACVCVSSACRGSEDLLGEDSTLIVHSGCPQDYASVVKQYGDNPEERRVIGKGLFNRAKAFSIENAVKAHAACYEEVMSPDERGVLK